MSRHFKKHPAHKSVIAAITTSRPTTNTTTPNQVLHFLTATPLGRAMHAFAAQPGAVVAGYPAWLGRVARWGQEEDASSSCAAAVAAAGEGYVFDEPVLCVCVCVCESWVI